MIDSSQTLEEARKHRYNEWAGNPKGSPYNEERCAEEVWPRDRWVSYQCTRKNGYGPEGLYCKQHAKKSEGEKS